MGRQDSALLLRLSVIAESDAGAICAVLQRFQNLNIVPQRVGAELRINDQLFIEVDVSDMTDDQMEMIALKIVQLTFILNANWQRLS